MLELLSAIVTVASLSSSIIAAPARPASCTIENRPASIARSVEVDYPAVAKSAGLTGTTVVRVDLSDTGKILATYIAVSSGSKILDFAAQRTAAAMTYAPEIRSCARVQGSYAVQVEFANS